MQVSLPLPRSGKRSGQRVPRRFRARWLLVPLVLLAIAGGVVWWVRSRNAATTSTVTTTTTVKQGSLTLSVSGSGSVAAAHPAQPPPSPRLTARRCTSPSA